MRSMIVLLMVTLCARATAEDIVGEPLGDALVRLKHPQQLRTYGLTDPHIRSFDVWYHVEVDGGTYGLVFGTADVFVGVTEKTGEDQWRFIPYSGKKRFFHKRAKRLTQLESGELALWFLPDEAMQAVDNRVRTSGLRITEILEAERRGEIHKYVRDIYPDPVHITFSAETNTFTDDDVIAIQTPGGVFYPEHEFPPPADQVGQFKLIGLWKHNPTQQWERYELLTYSELVGWDMTEAGEVRLRFTLDRQSTPGRGTLEEVLFDPREARMVSQTSFKR